MIFLFRLPLEIAFNTISLQTSALAFTYFVRIVSSLLAIVLSFCLFLAHIMDFSMAFFYSFLRTSLYCIIKILVTKILILLYNILYIKRQKKGITKMADENKNLTPVWIAYVDGKRLSTDYEGALRKIYINDRLDFIGTASLLFDIPAVDFDNDDIFVLGSEVSIHLGYKDDVEEVFVGEVTEFAPRFEEYNAPSMEVKIQTKLNELKKGHKCKSFENKTPASIIKDIVSKYDLTPDVEDFGPENIYTEQYSLTDYDYITYLADKYGKFIYCYNNTV